MIADLFDWLNQAPIWVMGIVLIAGSFVAALIGHWVRIRHDRRGEPTSEGQEGYIVSAMLGLLGLLLGFTLAMAVERFDARRVLVLQEANAIGKAYLRTQLLGEPHRTRLSKLIVDYTDNRLLLATANTEDTPRLLEVNETLITDMWSATAAAFDSIETLDFSTSFVESINGIIDSDAARKTARLARVPATVFAVLLLYIVFTSGVLGYVLLSARSRGSGAFLVVLLSLSLLLIIDLDRPNTGSIRESQGPIERLRQSLMSWPPQVFDRWREAAMTPAEAQLQGDQEPLPSGSAGLGPFTDPPGK
jgi:hypothetical protein